MANIPACYDVFPTLTHTANLYLQAGVFISLARLIIMINDSYQPDACEKNKFSILVFEICVDSGRSARGYRSVRIKEISHEGSLIPVTLKILKVIEKAYIHRRSENFWAVEL